MPSLIGSAPNQVPTNGMLGTMAFQDADNASVATKAVTDNSTSPASTAFVKQVNDINNEILTTTGTGGTYVLTPTIPISAYQAGQVFTAKFHVDCLSSPAINVSGLGAVPLLMKNAGGGAGSPPNGTISANSVAKIRYNGTAFEFTEVLPATSTQAIAGTNTFNYISPWGLRQGLNASGSAPIYACRAWVNFNGTGTVAIRASGNVTSITDNGVGDYTVNFTTAMEDANYAVVFGAGQSATTSDRGAIAGIPGTANGTPVYSTTAVRFTVTATSGTTLGANDCSIVNVAVFR